MTPTRSARRFGALDLLRGFTVAAMIVVNNPGNWSSVFAPLSHAAWNGLTVADLIFPAFIFIMGVATAFTLTGPAAAARAPHLPRHRWPRYRRIASRAAALVVLGLLLNLAAAWPDLGSFRAPGVLQRIGVTYALAAVITLELSDVQQWAAIVVLLVAHWAMLALWPTGAPGGPYEPGSNLAAVIDRALFGSHLLSPDTDPEGALGVITSVATALAGAGIGRWLQRSWHRGEAVNDSPRAGLATLAILGLAAIGIGVAWSVVLPLNKALWTGSFVLVTSGATTLLLVVFALLERTRGAVVLAPLRWLGINALAVYFLSELFTNILQRPLLRLSGHLLAPKDWFYWNVLAPAVRDAGGRWSSLAYAVLYACLWIGVAGVMRWRGIRIRV